MKLWYSLIKEIKIALRSWYFLVELIVALLFLFLLLFVIPEDFSSKSKEVLYLNLPEMYKTYFANLFKDLDGKVENFEFKIKNRVISTKLYENEEKKIYVVDKKQDMIDIAKNKKYIGAIVSLDENNKLHYEYYLQGFENQRLKNLLLIAHVKKSDMIEKSMNNQIVKKLHSSVTKLTDKENFIPMVLVLNGSMMGLFIIAAFIFLDKDEGVIKAFAVTASSVTTYLLSKTLVLILTTVITTLIIVIPVIGFNAHYGLMILFLIATGFFSAALGLFLTSFYDNLMQSFGALYLIIILIMLPGVSYFNSDWDPIWVRYIPSYPMFYVFRETLLKDCNSIYVLTYTGLFILIGLILFFLSDYRFKRTLRV